MTSFASINTLPPANALTPAFLADPAHTFFDVQQPGFSQVKSSTIAEEPELAFQSAKADGFTQSRADFDYWTGLPPELRWGAGNPAHGGAYTDALKNWMLWLNVWGQTFPAMYVARNGIPTYQIGGRSSPWNSFAGAKKAIFDPIYQNALGIPDADFQARQNPKTAAANILAGTPEGAWILQALGMTATGGQPTPPDGTKRRVGSPVGIQFLTVGDISPDSLDVPSRSPDANANAVMGITGMRTVEVMQDGRSVYSPWKRFPLRGVRYLDTGASDSSQVNTGWWFPVTPAQIGESAPPPPSRQERAPWGSIANVTQSEKLTFDDAVALGAGVKYPPEWGRSFPTIDQGPPPITIQPADSPYAPKGGGTIDAPIRPDASLPTAGPNNSITTVPLVTTLNPRLQVEAPPPGPPPAAALPTMKWILIAVIAVVVVALANAVRRK